MNFRRNASKPPAVVINGDEIERVSSYMYLGVHLNVCLSWSGRIDAKIKKLKKHILHNG